MHILSIVVLATFATYSALNVTQDLFTTIPFRFAMDEIEAISAVRQVTADLQENQTPSHPVR